MFESLRKSLEELLDKATPPEERRVIAARMKDTLVQARMGLDDLREGLEQTRRRLDLERRELETVRRRRTLAEAIADAETVRLAIQYETMHAERVDVLERKVAVQESELALGERDVASMAAELRAVMSGARPAVTPSPEAQAEAELDRELDPTQGGAEARAEIDALGRQRARADREADADRRLEELKRRMGK